MAHNITARDIQAGLENAWHRKTKILEHIGRDDCMPWEIEECPMFIERTIFNEDGIDVQHLPTESKQLIASDDGLPISTPYETTYHPSSVAAFWATIEEGLKGVDYKVVSAGTVENREKLFASVKVTDGFRIKDREYKDYITFLDSFNRTMAFQVRYTNVCVVCSNTFAMAMQSGEEVGSAKHTFNLGTNVERLIKSLQAFTSTSKSIEELFSRAEATACSNDEAKAWFTGVIANEEKGLTNAAKQKTARLSELFVRGAGQEGRTRLDALQAVTEFHTHESSNRKNGGHQYYTSEFGTSATVKGRVVQTFEHAWVDTVKKGEKLLALV